MLILTSLALESLTLLKSKASLIADRMFSTPHELFQLITSAFGVLDHSDML